MRRRQFLTGGTAGAASSLWPLAARRRTGAVDANKFGRLVYQGVGVLCGCQATRTGMTMGCRWHYERAQVARSSVDVVASVHVDEEDYLSGSPALRRSSKKCSASSVRLKPLIRA